MRSVDIVNTTPSFPNLVVDTMVPWLATNIEGIPEQCVFKRDLKADDRSGSLGVVWVDWMPIDQEIGQYEPSLGRYTFVVQVMTRDTKEEVARALHANISKSVRDGLYRPTDLRVSLQQLSIVADGSTERFMKLNIVQQNSGSIEEMGNYIYLSMLTFTIDTEVVHVTP